MKVTKQAILEDLSVRDRSMVAISISFYRLDN
jgi:hypothetical protein